MNDEDVEAIVAVFSDLLRRRLYELKDAYLGALEAQLRAAAEKLQKAARPWPTAADCSPTAAEISAKDPDQTRETNCEESNEEPSI